MPTFEILKNGNVKITIPIALKSCSGRKRVIAPDVAELPSDPLVQNIVRAFRWQQLIDKGDYANVNELARALGKERSYVSRTVRLALLCPAIVHAALTGKLPDGISLDTLYKAVADDWTEQKKIVGLK